MNIYMNTPSSKVYEIIVHYQKSILIKYTKQHTFGYLLTDIDSYRCAKISF